MNISFVGDQSIERIVFWNYFPKDKNKKNKPAKLNAVISMDVGQVTKFIQMVLASLNGEEYFSRGIFEMK